MKFNLKKPNRYMKGFLCVQTKDYWFQDGKWVKFDLLDKEKEYTNNQKCKTVKAFRRILRKNPHIRNQSKLYHKFVSCDVYG